MRLNGCYLLGFCLNVWVARALDFPAVVPAVQSYSLLNTTGFSLAPELIIVVDEASSGARDADGMTLIPPSLLEFAQTLAQDLHSLFPDTSVKVSTGSLGTGEIFLSVAPTLNSTLASGLPTTEGYLLNVTESVVITGTGARGAFWATRTLLQGLILGNGTFPAAEVFDHPDWETRGYMLDVGRQWYPISFLKELCTYGSWFKANEFHTHLSDNVSPVIQNVDANMTYARFRLRPETTSLAGLTPFINETYSQAEFEDFQQHCAARGVTVIPEIESPGHALVITQWKPELALSTDPTLINLTMPDAIPTVKDIWSEFLPALHSKQVSIGADEYDADLADDYITFVNDMASLTEFIGQWNKSIRIWGTNEPSNTLFVSKDITIQHWEFFEDNPFDLIEQGYNVINSDDGFQYIVMKFSGSYPQMLNQTRLWDGANVDSGGIWDPRIFDRGYATDNPAITDPLLQGSIMACWNDHGPWASTYLEAFYAVKRGLPVVAANAWQSSSRPNHLTFEQFTSSFDILEASAPAQNLDRRIAFNGTVVVDYNNTFASLREGSIVPDLSGNGYDASLLDGSVVTPLGSKGHNYTMRLIFGSKSVLLGTLLSGPDDELALLNDTLAFISSNITYPLSNYTLPSTGWTQIVVQGTESGTEVFVDGEPVGEFRVDIDATTTSVPLAFVAPVHTINAGLTRFTLWDGLVSV
ncbi:glycoside hydrolase family 20 protein [Peniophora sp. CONT]|nr:glycoside hydrolase family 20 protein [Peniophora sp. CONT]